MKKVRAGKPSATPKLAKAQSTTSPINNILTIAPKVRKIQAVLVSETQAPSAAGVVLTAAASPAVPASNANHAEPACTAPASKASSPSEGEAGDDSMSLGSSDTDDSGAEEADTKHDADDSGPPPQSIAIQAVQAGQQAAGLDDPGT